MKMDDVIVNQKLQGVNVHKLIVEGNNYNGSDAWRVYVAKTGASHPPIFLFQNGTGRVGLGTTDVYVEQLNLKGGDPHVPIDWDERTAREFALVDHQLKRFYTAILNPKSEQTWNDFADVVKNFFFYRITPPVNEKTLLELTPEEIETAIRNHVCGGFDLDPRIYAWGLGGLVRLPQHSRYVGWTKFRGHSLIVKASKAGCSHIAARTTPKYDKVSPKSFEGYADVDGGVFYSPLHENFHAATLDEFGQLDDGIMVRLFAFMESGIYDTVKASRRIVNKGNCRVSFITNPPAMGEGTFGQTFAIDSMMNAFFDCVYKLSEGNFEGAMSRFGLVFVSRDIVPAKGKELPFRIQDRANAVASSVFEVIAPKVAKIFEDEQTQAWLSTRIDYYDEGIKELTKGFDDPRLIRAWWGQSEAYRHVRGAALEIAVAENAYQLLHNQITVEELIEDASGVLEDVVRWNLVSLQEIVSAAQREETVPLMATRILRSRPKYIPPILMALCMGATGRELDLELAYDRLPRRIRDILEPERFYCWSHISSRIRQPGALPRLVHALAAFGVRVQKLPDGTFSFGFERPEMRDKVRAALHKAYSSIDEGATAPIEIIQDCPTVPNVPPTLEKTQGQLGTVLGGGLLTVPNCPQTVPRLLTSVGGHQGQKGEENAKGILEDPNRAAPQTKRVVFDPGGGSHLEEVETDG